MDVTTDDVHDSEILPELLKDASMNRDVIKAYTIQGIHTSFLGGGYKACDKA
jgi:hypothetical protein